MNKKTKITIIIILLLLLLIPLTIFLHNKEREDPYIEAIEKVLEGENFNLIKEERNGTIKTFANINLDQTIQVQIIHKLNELQQEIIKNPNNLIILDKDKIIIIDLNELTDSEIKEITNKMKEEGLPFYFNKNKEELEEELKQLQQLFPLLFCGDKFVPNKECSIPRQECVKGGKIGICSNDCKCLIPSIPRNLTGSFIQKEISNVSCGENTSIYESISNLRLFPDGQTPKIEINEGVEFPSGIGDEGNRKAITTPQII